VAQLRLLEVGGHPQPFQRNQHQQVLPRRDVLVDFDALAGDDAGRGRDNARITQVQFGHVELRLRLLHLRLGLLGAGTLRGHLLGPGLGVLQAGLSLRLALHGYLHTVDGSLLVGAGVGHGGLGGVGGGHGGVKLLLADDVFFHQRLVALQIGLRLGVLAWAWVTRACAAPVASRPAPRRPANRSHSRPPSADCCRC
jgi:hypothetical protein